MDYKQLTWWLLTATAFLGLLLPVMIKEGMFLDGVLYASVSKNLANGVGSFWFPEFDKLGKAGLSSFHEHPPLFFAIQAVFFRIFGDGYFVEKLFSFFAALITGCGIILFWRLIHKKRPAYIHYSWIPVLLWIIIPIVFYSYQHNLIEGTMSIFVLFAVYFPWKGLSQKKYLKINIILGGLFVFLASFTKGVPGLFPLVFPFLWWLIKRDISLIRMIKLSLIMLSIPVIIYGIMITVNQDALLSLTWYVEKRLIGRIETAPTVSTRYHILIQWLIKMMPVFIINLIVVAIDRFKSFQKIKDQSYKKEMVLLFVLGTAGVIPLMLTLIQKSFYFLPALPFFAIAFGMFLVPAIADWISKLSSRINNLLILLMGIALIGILVFTITENGKPGKDADIIAEVHQVGEMVPSNILIEIPFSLSREWTLRTYFIRYYNITLDYSGEKHPYILLEKDSIPTTEGIEKIPSGLKLFELYKRN